MDYQSIVQYVDEEIAKLEQAKGVLRLAASGRHHEGDRWAEAGGKKAQETVMSEEARARIAEAQRQRWARAKKAKRTAPAKVSKKAVKKTAPAKTKRAVPARIAIKKASAKSEAPHTESTPV